MRFNGSLTGMWSLPKEIQLETISEKLPEGSVGFNLLIWSVSSIDKHYCSSKWQVDIMWNHSAFVGKRSEAGRNNPQFSYSNHVGSCIILKLL
jgi:hypothetical protein